MGEKKVRGRQKPGRLLGEGAVAHCVKRRKRWFSLLFPKLTLKDSYILTPSSASAPELPSAAILKPPERVCRKNSDVFQFPPLLT